MGLLWLHTQLRKHYRFTADRVSTHPPSYRDYIHYNYNFCHSLKLQASTSLQHTFSKALRIMRMHDAINEVAIRYTRHRTQFLSSCNSFRHAIFDIKLKQWYSPVATHRFCRLPMYSLSCTNYAALHTVISLKSKDGGSTDKISVTIDDHRELHRTDNCHLNRPSIESSRECECDNYG